MLKMSWNFLLKLNFNLFITKEMPREPSQPLRGPKSGMTIWKYKTLWKFWIFGGLWTVPLKEIIGFWLQQKPSNNSQKTRSRSWVGNSREEKRECSFMEMREGRRRKRDFRLNFTSCHPQKIESARRDSTDGIWMCFYRSPPRLSQFDILNFDSRWAGLSFSRI